MDAPKEPLKSPNEHPIPEPKKPKRVSWYYLAIIVFLSSLAFGAVWWFADQTNSQANQTEQNQPVYKKPEKSTEVPKLASETVVSNLDHPWEIAFLPSKEMLFTERSGKLSVLKDGNVTQVTKFDDAYSVKNNEAGLLGLAIDPDFSSNRYAYACLDSTLGGPDVRVIRFKIKSDLTGIEDRKDIVTGISFGNGRHSGCRVAFGPDGYLWIGTGDSAVGDTSIQPKKLGGKVLRVDRDGNAATGNVGGEYDSRIYSYGHRNIQGIAFYKKAINGVPGVNIEHGSNVDDEVNLLQKGNFGWAPNAVGYNETGVPMTDKTRFPDANEAIWSSGNPTQAPSGATFVKGRQWKAWDGALMVSMLKAAHLKVLTLESNKVVKEAKAFEGTFGRLRAAVQGPDGNLYISTDNGGSDQIVRIIPN